MQQTINGLAVGSIYALLGLGVTLIWGVLHVLTFTHAQVLTWGAFVTLAALNADWPVPVAILVGMLAAGAISAAIDAGVLEALRRRGASEHAFVVATIGVAAMMQALLKKRTGSRFEPLTQLSQNNSLLDTHPDLYFYGCLAQACDHIEDSAGVAKYGAMFGSVLGQVAAYVRTRQAALA